MWLTLPLLVVGLGPTRRPTETPTDAKSQLPDRGGVDPQAMNWSLEPARSQSETGPTQTGGRSFRSRTKETPNGNIRVRNTSVGRRPCRRDPDHRVPRRHRHPGRRFDVVAHGGESSCRAAAARNPRGLQRAVTVVRSGEPLFRGGRVARPGAGWGGERPGISPGVRYSRSLSSSRQACGSTTTESWKTA